MLSCSCLAHWCVCFRSEARSQSQSRRYGPYWSIPSHLPRWYTASVPSTPENRCVREHPALPGLVSEHPGCMSDRLDTPSMMPRVTGGGFRGQVSGRQMYVSLLNDINRWRGRHPDRSRQIMVHLYTCTTPGNPATCWCPHHHRQANLWGPHHQIHRFPNVQM
jgi:hypothetical protein